MLEEVAAPLFSVRDDRLLLGHAHGHGRRRQAEPGRRRMTLALGPARIVEALKQFHQGDLGIHARVLILRPSGVNDHVGWT